MARRAKNTAKQGASFERQIMHDLQRYGYLTMRSAASKGPADVIAAGDREVLVIQAKLSDPQIGPTARRAVLELADRMGPTAVPLVATKNTIWVVYRVLTGPGPKDWTPWEPDPTRYAPCAVTGCGDRLGSHDGTGCWGHVPAGCAVKCSGFELRPAGWVDTPVPPLS
jgi:hypothetical protein